MGKSLKQMFAAFTTAFVAIEILMQAVLHLCVWAEATSGAFEDEAKQDREAKAAERKLALGITPEADTAVAKAKAKAKA